MKYLLIILTMFLISCTDQITAPENPVSFCSEGVGIVFDNADIIREEPGRVTYHATLTNVYYGTTPSDTIAYVGISDGVNLQLEPDPLNEARGDSSWVATISGSSDGRPFLYIWSYLYKCGY